MQPDELNVQAASLPKTFAADVMKFYHGVIRENLAETDTKTSDKKTLSKLRNVYSKKLRKDDPRAVSFDGAEVRCAYLYQFCPSFTKAAASQFLAFLRDVSPEHVRHLALQPRLTVCCLGGGPGTEAVAICSVLAEVRRHWVRQNGQPLLVDAAIVDSEGGWSTTARDIVDGLSDLVDGSLVKIDRFRFVPADLTGDFSEEVREVLSRSHLVTMTKFLSALHGPKDSDARAKILRCTTSCMPVGGFLFILDSSGWRFFDEMSKVIGSFDWMESVYGPRKKTVRLSKSSKKVCFSSELYGNICCTLRSTNKLSVWCKKSSSCNGLASPTDDS